MRTRLDRFLASQGLGSRKEVSQLARRGLVAVNGAVVRDSAFHLDPALDRVTLEGREVAFRAHTTLMMNKPTGVLSATADRRRETVLDLLPSPRPRGLFPAGRLDKDTTGLLILTDDGDLAHRMLAPKSHVAKGYEARVARPVTAADVAAFAQGIQEGGQRFAPARLWAGEGEGGPTAWVELREGKYHQVKRMFQAVGNQVLSLKRHYIGGLWLDEALALGEARLLTDEEIQSIFVGEMHENAP